MFQRSLGPDISEVSHKRVASPRQSVYYNHIHNHCELLLFVSGQADFNIDGKIFTPAPYDLLFVPSATYHYLIPTASVPYENYVIGVDPALVGRQYDPLFLEPMMLNAGKDPRLLDFFTRLDDYAQGYAPRDFEVCVRGLLQELFTYCAYHKQGLLHSRPTGQSRVEEIIKYIHAHIHKPLDAADVAEQLMLSKSYVQNLFSEEMHIGLKKYIQQKKIYMAHADMAAGLPPGRACQKYGFTEYTGFYRLYKATFGCAPTGKNKQKKGE